MDVLERVVAVLLAGGKSSRMGGGDKSLRPLAGKPVLARIVERLKPQVSAMIINATEEFSFTVGAVPTLLFLVLAACFEELGWRGYAVESLNSNRSYFEATAIFGVLWSLWHLPMFFIPHSYQAQLLQEDFFLVLNFFVSIVPLAFIISWFCKKNSGSILGAVLIHSIINFTQEFFQVSPYTKCIQTLVLIVIAVVFVLADREAFFCDDKLA